MRVVVAMVAMVILAVADEVRPEQSKRYQLCTARDISMLSEELCSGRAGRRLRNGHHHRAPPANTGIMTIRVPSREVRGGRSRQDDDPPYQAPPLWNNLYNPKIFDEELPMMDGAADLLSAPEWEFQDSPTSYEDPSSEAGSRYHAPRSLAWGHGGRGEANPEYSPSTVMRLNTGNNGPKSRDYTRRGKRQLDTLRDLRVRCCHEGCEESELYSICM